MLHSCWYKTVWFLLRFPNPHLASLPSAGALSFWFTDRRSFAVWTLIFSPSQFQFLGLVALLLSCARRKMFSQPHHQSFQTPPLPSPQKLLSNGHPTAWISVSPSLLTLNYYWITDWIISQLKSKPKCNHKKKNLKC